MTRQFIFLTELTCPTGGDRDDASMGRLSEFRESYNFGKRVEKLFDCFYEYPNFYTFPYQAFR